jgi:hypothetical protein
MVSHDMSAFRSFDVIAELRHGQIVRHGKAADMLAPARAGAGSPGDGGDGVIARSGMSEADPAAAMPQPGSSVS